MQYREWQAIVLFKVSAEYTTSGSEATTSKRWVVRGGEKGYD